LLAFAKAAAFTLTFGIVNGQIADPSRLTFEAASIKPTDPAKPGPPFEITPSGRFNASTEIRFILRTFYGVHDFQIVGGPKWLDTDKYTIVAVPPLGPPAAGLPAPTQAVNNEQTTRRVQALLEDRFQLKVHRETREMPLYELVVAKGGSKLREVPQAEPGQFKLKLGAGRIIANGAKIGVLLNLFMNNLERSVVDKTGLTGYYAIDLTYAPDESMPRDGPSLDRPSLFTALQEQLGLKLESRKGPVEVLVIDNVARPSEN